MSARILVVGDVMTDIIVMPEGPMVKGSDRRAKIRNRPGGSGANQAAWLGSVDADVIFAARVGSSDRMGYENYFRGQGVVGVLASDTQLPTGVLVTIVDPDGERSFLTDRGANLNLCAEDLPDSLLDDVGLVLVSGYSLFEPGPRAAVLGLFAAARARKIAIAVDAASIGFLNEVGAKNFLQWTRGCAWLLANQDEARVLTGSTRLEKQMRVLGQNFDNVVIKRGRSGAAVGGRDGVVLTSPAPEVRVVDSTGAGDAFAAGLLSAVLGDATVEVALEAGIAAGARAVQAIGGQPL
ncbi:PfkB family carbohydrate kinase [Devosia rhodophyticola]|uniref:PfkB family carbohydrate kinase n=1 Tax=Devosia rhodophyticola TaxID=3026423 RepID=A0ABY7YUE2_9HYPH|nr:PfkB family carbohydrate kinase [Devosia rhodophyticola]WDR04569.1 PfkB family carbohydrate kinase [Devosia rhodophyticola]